MKKANAKLIKTPEIWSRAFKCSNDFVNWCKLVVKHIKKRQFIEIYGSYFIYCNQYIKNVSEVLKKLNLTLYGLIELMYEKQIINRKDNLNEYLNN